MQILVDNTMIRTVLGLWVACVFAMGMFGPAVARSDESGQEGALLKAVFVYNFAKLTSWPSGTWQDARSTLNLCVSGSDKLADSLQKLRHETIGGRLVSIEAMSATRPGRPCHVVYYARSEKDAVVGAITQMRDEPVLTISEVEGFAESGGMIQLYQDKDRIRFMVNHAATAAAGLKLSAALLDLAEIVGDELMP